MSIKITLKNHINEKLVNNYVLFGDENFKIYGLKKLSLNRYLDFIKKITNLNKFKAKDYLVFNINSSQKIIIIKLKKNQSFTYNEKQGAKFYNFIKSNSILDSTLFDQNIKEIPLKKNSFLDEFIHGIKLKSYIFDKYKSKKKIEKFNIVINSKKNSLNFNKNKRYDALIEGVNFTKDLVSEPGNILHPDEYSKRLKRLNKYGLKVVVYDENKLKKLGMNALLGVGQGSIRGSYLVTIEWKGSKSKNQPLAFVGKGVCFDTGGISLNPQKLWKI